MSEDDLRELIRLLRLREERESTPFVLLDPAGYVVRRWIGYVPPASLAKLPNENAAYPYRLCIGEKEFVDLHPGDLESAVWEVMHQRVRR